MSLFNTHQLKSALERLCLVVPKRGSLPVLENLRWRTTNGHLELTTTDLDNSLQIRLPQPAPAAMNDVDVLVPAREFYQLVKTESAPTLEIRIHDSKFEVNASRRTVVLPSSPPKNFPEIPDGELHARGKLLASALAAALEKALFCIAAESSRYSTDVLKLELRGSVFRIVGTDGHRLSLVEGAAQADDEKASFSALLPRSTAAVLRRLQPEEGPAWVQFATFGSDGQFMQFVMPDDAELIARRGVGQFPNYENVMPKTPLEARVVFQRDELIEGLTKLSPTARKSQSPTVKLELSKKPISIKTETDGTANRVSLEHTRVSGKARDIGFNHQYLTQYVKSLETETVSMKLFPKSISEVALFDTFRYQHLLMPMRD